MRLHVRAFALTCALLGGIALFLFTWFIIVFIGASQETTVFGKYFAGYRISPAGSLFGLIWGFVDGLVGGLIFAWLYNALLGRFRPAQGDRS